MLQLFFTAGVGSDTNIRPEMPADSAHNAHDGSAFADTMLHRPDMRPDYADTWNVSAWRPRCGN